MSNVNYAETLAKANAKDVKDIAKKALSDVKIPEHKGFAGMLVLFVFSWFQANHAEKKGNGVFLRDLAPEAKNQGLSVWCKGDTDNDNDLDTLVSTLTKAGILSSIVVKGTGRILFPGGHIADRGGKQGNAFSSMFSKE